MAKNTKSKKDKDQIEDEPGAEERFLRGVRKALNTPPTKRAEQPKVRPAASRAKR